MEEKSKRIGKESRGEGDRRENNAGGKEKEIVEKEIVINSKRKNLKREYIKQIKNLEWKERDMKEKKEI